MIIDSVCGFRRSSSRRSARLITCRNASALASMMSVLTDRPRSVRPPNSASIDVSPWASSPMVTPRMWNSRKVTVTPTNPVGAIPKPSIVSVFESDTGAAQAVIAVDLALAAHSGAVLSLFPPGVAMDAVKTGKMTDTLLENFGEVVNVLSSVFNVTEGVHVKLRNVVVCGPLPAGDVAPLVKKFKAEFAVNITGYTTGRMLVSV